MSELVKRLRASCIYDAVYGTKEEQGVCKKQMWEAADLIEKQDDEIKTLKSLAVCSSGEGTSFYYKDDWEARGKKIEKLERLLSLYRDYFKWLDDEYTKESWATGREIREKIKQMEETL